MSEKQHEIPGGSTVGAGSNAVSFDPSDPDQPSAAVVEVLAAAKDADPLELEPLHRYVDPDALNRLVDSGGPRDARTTVTLSVDGYEVRIEGTGTVVAERVER